MLKRILAPLACITLGLSLATFCAAPPRAQAQAIDADHGGRKPEAADSPPAPRPSVVPPPPEPAPGNQATATVVLGGGREWPGNRSDRGSTGRDDLAEDDDQRSLHGFRLGYLVMMNFDQPRKAGEPDTSPKRELRLHSPHQFVIGYEVAHRLRAEGTWLNVLLVGNAMVSGIEQSRFLPTANLLLGFEFARALQLGVGANLAPTDTKPAHMILAAGWTPRSGELYLPVHFFFVPDVDGHHRTGITVGVNWDH